MTGSTSQVPVPKAFISYAWGDEAHSLWVKDFATRLRRDGVDVTLDLWHAAPGDQIPSFMECAVQENDFVIAVCTPRYKSRSDVRDGGVGYEGDIMTAAVFTGANQRKFIPVLRSGKWNDAAPFWLLGRVYIDLTGDPYSESKYKELLRALHGAREVAPPIGPRPDFGADKTALSPALAPILDRPVAWTPTRQPGTIEDEIRAVLRPLMSDRDSRRVRLTTAFGAYPALLDQINLDETTAMFLDLLINTLRHYGEVEPGLPAVRVLLESIESEVGAGDRARIDGILHRLDTRPSRPDRDATPDFTVTILCDFDGTITPQDTTDAILHICAHPIWRIIEKKWKPRGEISTRECMLSQTVCIRRDYFFAQVDDYLNAVRLVPLFPEFVAKCRQLRVDLKVNSDGYDYAINKVLHSKEIKSEIILPQKPEFDWIRTGSVKIYSNQLHTIPLEDADLGAYLQDIEADNEKLRFEATDGAFCLYFPNYNNKCDAKQGTCKCRLAIEAKEGRRGVILIGNDSTDACAVQVADIVFVRLNQGDNPDGNELVQACESKKPKKLWAEFNSFGEIIKFLSLIDTSRVVSPKDLVKCMTAYLKRKKTHS